MARENGIEFLNNPLVNTARALVIALRESLVEVMNLGVGHESVYIERFIRDCRKNGDENIARRIEQEDQKAALTADVMAFLGHPKL